MSADIYLNKPACPTCGRAEASEDFNLTYNLTPMLREAGMPPWGEFVGLSGAEAGPKWKAAHDELAANPEKYQAMNPPNGWGTYEQAVYVLGEMAEVCERHPDLRVEAWL